MRAWSIDCQGIVAMAGVCWTIDKYVEKKSVLKYLFLEILKLRLKGLKVSHVTQLRIEYGILADVEVYVEYSTITVANKCNM